MTKFQGNQLRNNQVIWVLRAHHLFRYRATLNDPFGVQTTKKKYSPHSTPRQKGIFIILSRSQIPAVFLFLFFFEMFYNLTKTFVGLHIIQTAFYELCPPVKGTGWETGESWLKTVLSPFTRKTSSRVLYRIYSLGEKS